MANQGMARPDWTKLHPKNDHSPVPQLQGKQKTGKKTANPIIDTDLARDNLENDIPFADLQDLK